jgi:hypothetical protein
LKILILQISLLEHNNEYIINNYALGQLLISLPTDSKIVSFRAKFNKISNKSVRLFNLHYQNKTHALINIPKNELLAFKTDEFS